MAGVVAAAIATGAAAGMHANDGPALTPDGTTLHGTSGMRHGGTPGALPQSVPSPPIAALVGGRMLHVPPPTFTSSRANRNVLVASPFTEYDPVFADSEPTGSTTSAATANAGQLVSTLNACSALTPALAIPAVSAEPGERAVTKGTRNSISVSGSTPYDSFGSTRMRCVPSLTHSPRNGRTWISSSPRVVAIASSTRVGRPESRL